MGTNQNHQAPAQLISRMRELRAEASERYHYSLGSWVLGSDGWWFIECCNCLGDMKVRLTTDVYAPIEIRATLSWQLPPRCSN
tara:strand:- start:3876 stop:4124 length:249 start_codon:yes stop_codon:yes gene_type:complete